MSDATETELTWTNLSRDPQLFDASLELGDVGLQFMGHDLVGQLADAELLFGTWPELFVVVRAGERVVARAVSVPFSATAHQRQLFPDHGWDAVVGWAIQDAVEKRRPTHVAALDIQVAPAVRGRGVSIYALRAMRQNAFANGYAELHAPVRPTAKHSEPLTPMAAYAAKTRADGLPADGWLRAHVRVGGSIVRVAPFAMTVIGTLDQWREWCGLPFDHDGPVVVPGL